jgi:hypothetical protein
MVNLLRPRPSFPYEAAAKPLGNERSLETQKSRFVLLPVQDQAIALNPGVLRVLALHERSLVSAVLAQGWPPLERIELLWLQLMHCLG